MGVIGNAVPEPPPWAMMALGAVVLVGVQQLRRRKKA
jgi:MYXO-CTERM domain-containing protein